MIRFLVKINQSAFNEVLKKGAQKTFDSFLRRVAERIRFLMRLPKHGRFYGTHRASAPGEAPAILTGTLIGSIGQPVIRDFTGSMNVSAPYARYLEEGTPRILPRPYAEVSARGVVSELNRESAFGRLL